MPTNFKSNSIEQLLAEADELIDKITSDYLEDLEEEHRLQFERHAQALQEIKSAFKDPTGKRKLLEDDSFAEGMHQAISDILKAMKDLVGYLT
ncbi:MAG: hypothetical protein COX20_09595 [Desulfobacterales bacterium CG23_combo_of_CG06-09_8_20_14_all_52_9]|nr:MAG: hypothetical protein COX20_09595 [Desulfobacterales bacterium CG23_combo_of_CG06-09_8_20_14_all_52_9]